MVQRDLEFEQEAFIGRGMSITCLVIYGRLSLPYMTKCPY
jgi:hypothetical protein